MYKTDSLGMLLVAAVLITTIFSIVLIVNANLNHDYKMAQLGYTQQVLPGSNSVHWVKP